MFYWSKLYSSNIKSGQNYNSLKKTISILIANFEMENLNEIPKGHTEWKIREKDFSKIVLTNVFELHIIELPKIKRLKKEKNLEKWIKLLLNPDELGEFDMENDEAIKKAKEELDKLSQDEYEIRLAELRMKHIMDSKAIEDYGYDKGLEEGLKQGIEQTKIEIAKRMLEQGKSLEEIMELTELSKEDIEAI